MLQVGVSDDRENSEYTEAVQAEQDKFSTLCILTFL